MRIQPPKQIQLVFHKGAKKLTQPKGKLIDDNWLLTWKENDRAIAAFLKKKMKGAKTNPAFKRLYSIGFARQCRKRTDC